MSAARVEVREAAEGVVRDSVEADAGPWMMDGQGGAEAGAGVEVAKRPLPRRGTGGRANESRRPGGIDRYGEGIERTGQPLAARLDESLLARPDREKGLSPPGRGKAQKKAPLRAAENDGGRSPRSPPSAG